MRLKVIITIAMGVALGQLFAKGLEVGGRKTLKKGNEVFNKKVREVVAEGR